MVALTFPDGARRDYPPNTTGLDIAKSISPSLAKRTVAMALDEANRTGRIKHGDYVLMVVFGGGLTWASTVVEW